MKTKNELFKKLKDAANLLNSAKCPDCDGGGVIVREIVKTGTRWVDDGEGNPLPEPYPIQDYEPSQCFWCYHKDNLLSEIVVIEKQIKKQESEVSNIWISVNEELPTINGFYICWCGDEPGLIHYHKDTGWQNGFYDDKVTHWKIILPPNK